jgi:hypothetical protein
MLAHAYLTVMRALTEPSNPTDLLETALELLPLTVAEVRHLLWQTAWSQAPPLGFILAWSLWRRRHQARARRSHAKRRRRKQMGNVPIPAEQQGRRGRERSKSRRGQQKGKGGTRLLTQVQYTAEGQYLLVGKTEAPSSFSPDSPTFQALLESMPSFHFSGKNGHFTAHKEQFQGKYYYWRAYRNHHNKLYKQFIGTTAKLSPQHLEQVASALQLRMAQSTSQSGKEATPNKA